MIDIEKVTAIATEAYNTSPWSPSDEFRFRFIEGYIAATAAAEAKVKTAAGHVKTMFRLTKTPLEGKDATASSRACAFANEILKG
jgi:hypothetical protein